MSKRNVPLPPELQRYSGYPDLTFVSAGEWSAGHPGCPAPASTSKTSDRLRLFASNGSTGARVWCRRCGLLEFADENDVPEYVRERRASRPAREAQYEQEREAHLAAEHDRMTAKIRELQEQAYWRGWHDAMTQAHRDLWSKQGIDVPLQDRFMLGYTQEKAYSFRGELFSAPALTIPIFKVGWEPVNVQYRLLDAPPQHGKYRFTSGLDSALFLCDPDTEPHGRALVVEGAKKAIVTYKNLVLESGDFDYVVAVPSVTPTLSLFDQLADCDDVVIALDPDAWEPSNRHSLRRIAKHLKEEGRGASFIQLPTKPDDFFTMYHGTASQFMAYVEQGETI